MKIKKTHTDKRKRFKDVAEGNIFEYSSGCFYLKVAQFKSVHFKVNAIRIDPDSLYNVYCYLSENLLVIAEYDSLTLGEPL